MIQLPGDQKFLHKKETVELNSLTPNIDSRVDLKVSEGERSVQQPPRVHFPVQSRSQNTHKPNKRAKYNKFYRTQNFKKNKKKISLFEQIERQHRQANSQNVQALSQRGHKPHPLDIFNSRNSNHIGHHSQTLKDFMVPTTPSPGLEDSFKIRFRDQQLAKSSEYKAYYGSSSPGKKHFGNTDRMWKFKGKELIIKKPNSKYRSKYMQFNKNGSIHKNTRSNGGQFNTFSQTKKTGNKWSTGTGSHTPNHSLNHRNIFELSDMNKISKTYNPYKKDKGAYDKNGRRVNKPQSPIFIRRGLFDNHISKIQAGFENWNKNLAQEDDTGAFGLEEYISVDRRKQLDRKTQSFKLTKNNGSEKSFVNKFSSKDLKILMDSSSEESNRDNGKEDLEAKLTNRVYMNDSVASSDSSESDEDEEEETESSSDEDQDLEINGD